MLSYFSSDDMTNTQINTLLHEGKSLIPSRNVKPKLYVILSNMA